GRFAAPLGAHPPARLRAAAAPRRRAAPQRELRAGVDRARAGGAGGGGRARVPAPARRAPPRRPGLSPQPGGGAAAARGRAGGRPRRWVRDQLLAEARALRTQADLLLERVLRAVPTGDVADEVDLVVGPHLALLDQPEFRDPGRIRALLGALEEKERLADVVIRLLEGRGAFVAFGGDLGDPARPPPPGGAAPDRRAPASLRSPGASGA